MAKVTKAQLVNAIKEVNKEFAMEPEMKTTGTVADLEKVIEVEVLPELEDDDKFTKATQAVIDYVLGKVNATDEENKSKAPAKEEKKEEKPAKKEKKTKKSKKEKVKKEKPVKEVVVKKEKKSKKEAVPAKEAEPVNDVATSKIDDAALYHKIKDNKKISKDDLLKLVKSEKAFKAKKKELKAVKSVFSLKKQMLDMLEIPKDVIKAKEAAEKTKAAPKPKKENPLVKAIKAAKKFKALKTLLKENKKSFPGIKAKKFDDVEALRTALLKITNTEVSKKTRTTSRIAVQTEVIIDNPKMNRKELIEEADKIYHDVTGAENNLKQQAHIYGLASKAYAVVEKRILKK